MRNPNFSASSAPKGTPAICPAAMTRHHPAIRPAAPFVGEIIADVGNRRAGQCAARDSGECTNRQQHRVTVGSGVQRECRRHQPGTGKQHSPPPDFIRHRTGDERENPDHHGIRTHQQALSGG